jgi:NDP-sugar pyrophosphorylase family protein
MPDACLDLGANIEGFSETYPEFREIAAPWGIPPAISDGVRTRIAGLSEGEYEIEGEIAVHHKAKVEAGATLKPPAQVMAGAFIAVGANLRGGVIVGCKARIGPGCEVKASLIGAASALAHFNYVGDSIVGANVNLEAGAVVANHFNERADRRIFVRCGENVVDTGIEKFGALIGDNCRIGANAVLSPGTILPRGSIVGRLELVAPVAH